MIIMAMGFFSAFINLIRDLMIFEDFIKLARQVVQYKYIKAVLWIFRLKLLAICWFPARPPGVAGLWWIPRAMGGADSWCRMKHTVHCGFGKVYYFGLPFWHLKHLGLSKSEADSAVYYVAVSNWTRQMPRALVGQQGEKKTRTFSVYIWW